MELTPKLTLVTVATDLASELKALGLPLRFRRARTPERLKEIDGWWISLADWIGRPSLGICIDRSLGLDNHTIWTGFWLPIDRKQEIVELNERLPSSLRAKTELTDARFSKGLRWRLLERPAKRALLSSFVEYYDGYECYLGIYDEGGMIKFDLARAAAFVQDVMHVVGPKTMNGKRTPAPAKKAYMRYVERFEVKVSPLHDRLQNRFEEFLRKSEKKDILPNVGGVDLRYRDSGIPVFCEVKPSTPDTARFAIRAAMGQLLDYRQSSPRASMMIVLSVRPSPRDMEFALSNGFCVAFPSGNGFQIETAGPQACS
ncbi:MAG: hypothetical protein JHD07_10100 [Bradyrhizobium sp.]|uniref:hypothetical protein n=1 Tax=Bradyrhizobium sp. TaxID=376 RepID=UPI001A2754AA|nr:hypothetical protein [Bradyrhizobium sp.]MBJ7403616.1 hypothetical protein [Bradyrhizobium sp.]